MLSRYSLLWLAFVAIAEADASSQPNITAILAEVPHCALECILNGLSASSNCTIANPRCICSDADLLSDLNVCVQGACAVAQWGGVAAANAQLCEGYPIETRGWEAVWLNTGLSSITFPAVFLRCYSRWTVAKAMWWDDWAVLVAATLLVGVMILDVLDVQHGFGRHFWNVQAADAIVLLQIFYVGEILYLLVMAATKVSILLFYLRVFQRPMFRKLVLLNIVFVIASCLSFLMSTIFQCTPLDGIWDKTITSTCIDANAVAYSSSAVGIFQDILILALPIPELATLHMKLRKKLNVIGMFSIGGLACITSIIRLKSLVLFVGSKDPSWDNVTGVLWSFAEMNVAVICACLPAIRAVASKWLPTLFAFTNKGSADSSGPGLSSQGKIDSRRIREEEDAIDITRPDNRDDVSRARAGEARPPPVRTESHGSDASGGSSQLGQNFYYERTSDERTSDERTSAERASVERTSAERTYAERMSAEEELLDIRAAIPLRRINENHIAMQMLTSNARVG